MKLVLWLDYLPASPNRILHRHWRVAHNEKKKARSALFCALSDAQQNSSTGTTSLDPLSLSSINYALRALYRTTIPPLLSSKYLNKKLNIGVKPEPESK